MGDPNRRVELRVARLEKAMDAIVDRVVAKVNERCSQTETRVNAVAEAAGSALAMEALVELAGADVFEAKLREISKRKQAEAEAEMSGRVKAAVEQGKLKPAEEVGKDSLVVGQRTEGADGKVSYRVDLYPAPEAFHGKKAGDVVEDGMVKTEIREVYEVVKEPAQPEAQA